MSELQPISEGPPAGENGPSLSLVGDVSGQVANIPKPPLVPGQAAHHVLAPIQVSKRAMASASALLLFWSKKRRESARADHYENLDPDVREDHSETYRELYRFTSAVPGAAGNVAAAHVPDEDGQTHPLA